MWLCLLATGGGRAAVLIRDPLSAQEKRVKGDGSGDEDGAGENECVKEGYACPEDVAAVKATSD